MFVLLALTVYAGYLGADRGLMLLLVTSVLATLVMAMAMLGRGRMAVSVLALVVTLGSVGAWLRVSPTELASRPMTLATPQVRFAAVSHTRALERQLLVARSGARTRHPGRRGATVSTAPRTPAAPSPRMSR